MGIPRLISHLASYALDTDINGCSVVIDGPAFAYHVYYLCITAQKSAKNPFEGIPSYQLIEDTALRWLSELRSCQVIV